MSAMTRKLLTCFPELKPGQFSIQYQDEEGEQIEVMNDDDLVEALAVFKAIGRVLSLSVLPKPTNTVESDESDDSDGETSLTGANAEVQTTKPEKKKNPLFEKRPRNFRIGGDIQPKRDLTRFVKWPRYITLQR